MSNRTSLCIAEAAAVCLLAVPLPGAAQSSGVEGSVSGCEWDGPPHFSECVSRGYIPDVELTFFSNGRAVRTVMTDESGRYRAPLPPGYYQFEVRHPEYGDMDGNTARSTTNGWRFTVFSIGEQFKDDPGDGCRVPSGSYLEMKIGLYKFPEDSREVTDFVGREDLDDLITPGDSPQRIDWTPGGDTNSPPQMRITHPGDGDRVSGARQIEVRGTAKDREDGVLTGSSLVWYSRYKDRDGKWTAGWKREGTGTSHTILVSKAAWTSRQGRNARADYEIRLVATDSGGKSSEDVIAVWLQRPR